MPHDVVDGPIDPRLVFAAGEHQEPDPQLEALALERAVKRLALLTAGQYEVERKGAAKDLGVRTAALDRLVSDERGRGETGGRAGRKLDLPQDEPWPEPVLGDALLAEIYAVVCRHVALSPDQAVAVALWVAFAWVADAFAISPRLNINAAEKGSGKSTLLDTVAMLAPRALPAASISASALFRVVEAVHPTLLLDEVDLALRGESGEAVRQILNAGHRAGMVAIRCGGENGTALEMFDTRCPLAMAGIGRLHPTLEDRAIPVTLRRALPAEMVGLEPVRMDRADQYRDLRRRCRRWADDARAFLASHEPCLPDGIHGRRADNWRVLLAVADQAGGAWPDRAAQAAEGIEAGQKGEGETHKVMLLADLREMFGASDPETRMPSARLVAELVKMEGRPWPEMPSNGKPVTPNQLARMLRPFGVRPADMWDAADGRRACKGYRVGDLHDAFARYLPPLSNRETARNGQ